MIGLFTEKKLSRQYPIQNLEDKPEELFCAVLDEVWTLFHWKTNGVSNLTMKDWKWKFLRVSKQIFFLPIGLLLIPPNTSDWLAWITRYYYSPLQYQHGPLTLSFFNLSTLDKSLFGKPQWNSTSMHVHFIININLHVRQVRYCWSHANYNLRAIKSGFFAP